MLRYIYCITQHTILLLKGQVASQFHFSLTELLIITCDYSINLYTHKYNHTAT